MREILFRGKRKDNGKWVEGHYGEYYSGKEKVSCISISKETISGSLYYDVIPETVGQYTGLTDKNGTRIFEGDIIRHYYKNLAKNGYTSDEGVVKWDCKECFFYRTSLSGEDKTISVDCIYKVIGNIYDNPELLKNN